MWVEILKMQTKPCGIYVNGQVFDLPERILAQLDEGSYKKTVSPWEEHKKETEPEPTEPLPPPMEELGEAEFPKEAETDGPKKAKGQGPKRTPPKKH